MIILIYVKLNSTITSDARDSEAILSPLYVIQVEKSSWTSSVSRVGEREGTNE